MLDRVVAVVGREAISWSELYRAMEAELARMARDLPESERQAVYKRNESRFLGEMIDMRLELQEAERLGLSVPDEELRATIEGIRKKYGLDEEAFLKLLASQGYTTESYKKMLREQILARKTVDRAVRSKVTVTAEDVALYMADRGLHDDTLYEVRQIFLRIPDGGSRDAVSRRLEEVMARLRAGEDFGALARRYSDDPSAARTGGSLGVIEKEHLSPDFARAVENMKPGDVSEPFEGAGGLHIVKLDSKGTVRQMLEEERFASEYRRWLKRLRENAFIEIRK